MHVLSNEAETSLTLTGHLPACSLRTACALRFTSTLVYPRWLPYEMADLWPVGAGVLALLIFLLGFAHARRPWGVAYRPSGIGLLNKACVLCFAMGPVGSITAAIVWERTGKLPAYLISLESPWMIGLVIEVCIHPF